MDIEEIEKLMIAMNTHAIHELEIQENETSILLRKAGALSHASFMPAQAPAATVYAPSPAPAVAPSAASDDSAAPAGQYVTAPIVGTYYASPSPDAACFVKVGDRVSADSVVCIIEAMKVMNEIKAGLSGIVAEILVNNGDPVEFGTKILRIT